MHLANIGRKLEHMADLITHKHFVGDSGPVDTERGDVIKCAHARLTRTEFLLVRPPLTEFKEYDEMIDSSTELRTTTRVLPGLLPMPEFLQLHGDQRQHADQDQQKPDGDQLKHERQQHDGDQHNRDNSDVNQHKLDKDTYQGQAAAERRRQRTAARRSRTA
ncbi:unnamed protein product [Prorocentrum cordatum]|uniref:Pre-mRNA-splicing factor 38 n=1 Tax=Prorocentrum cordatum TaxID=2364126 RepID=A0ABN9TFA1_9DINO|nr:unnamed protein product [Polarella glacialis]